MILIFGGTTEGRKAINVCEDGGKSYYYSTKETSQKVELVHGSRITGALDIENMRKFCLEKDIKLIIDVAHPFAENLHQNIDFVSQRLKIPVIRLERNYPNRDKNILWFDSYDDAIEYLQVNNIDNLLALTGVNTIGKLKPYWLHHNCIFRILDRDESRAIVKREDFPSNKILYYDNNSDETSLFEYLKPKAIITKESGESGGFLEKIQAAQELHIPILAVKKPILSDYFISVYSETDLRKHIEYLLPDFFNLKIGYTTGSSATAATKAALTTLLVGKKQEEVYITLPNNERVKIPIFQTEIKGNEVSSTVLKDAGDDPDVTNGQEIISTVKLSTNHKGVRFLQGIGVGKVTLPGLGLEIGDPAINKTPRMMMKREIFKVMRHYEDRLPINLGLKIGVDVTISVPNGEEISKKTFNPKLGIEGGISIIGTSGIVKPFSSDAFIASIRREMEVAKALGCTHIVINSGAKSEQFIKKRYPQLLSQAFIHYGNFIGETINIASDLDIEKLTLGIMLGKAVKLAEGSLDTHSKKVVMNKNFLKKIAKEANCNTLTIEAIDSITMARQLWDIIPQCESLFFKLILEKCSEICLPLFTKGELELLLITDNGNIIQ